MYLFVSLSQRVIISSIDLFFSRDWAGLEGGTDADVAMAGAAGLLESVTPVVEVLPGAAVVVVVDAVGLLPNSGPAPRDGAVVVAVAVLVEAGAVVVAVTGVLLKRLWVGAVDVVDAGAVGLSVPAAGGVPKRFKVVGVVALEPPNKFEVGAAAVVVVVVGVEAAGVGNRGFCAAVPVPPKVVVVAVVGAVGVLLVSSQFQRTFTKYHLLTPKRFDLVVVGVEAAAPPPNILLVVDVEAVAAPPPNMLVFAGAGVAEASVLNMGFVSEGLAAKIFDVPAVLFPKSPGAVVDPALAEENKLGEVAVVLSAACVVAVGPKIDAPGFVVSVVGVAGLSPPVEELLNIPPVEDAGLFPPKIPEVGVEAATATGVAGFPKGLDPLPNSAEPPVAPAAPPKAVVVPLPNVGVLAVAVDA